MGDLNTTGEGFELAEGSTGFGEAAVTEADAGENAAEGVGRSVAGVDQDTGTVGNVAKVEFLETVTGAVVEFEAVDGKRDGGIGGVVESIFRRIIRRFEGSDIELVTVENGTDGAVGVKFFTDEDEGVEVGLHDVKGLKVWDDSFYRLFVWRRQCAVSGRSSGRSHGQGRWDL